MSLPDLQRRDSTCGWPLPQELTDRIIDFLHNDRATLFSCTLVSPTWLRSSRLHLLSDDELLVPDSDLDVFLAWTGSCELAPQYLRHVTLYGRSTQRHTANRRNPVTQTYLIDLLACLPRLKSLHLSHVMFQNPNKLLELLELQDTGTALLKALFSLPSSPARRFELQKFVVSNCDFLSLATYLQIFRRLSELHVHSMRSSERFSAQELSSLARNLAGALPPLDTVIIDDNRFRSNFYIQAFAEAPALQRIRSLDVRSSCAWNRKNLGSLLNHVGGGLQWLGLNLSSFEGLRDPQNIPRFCSQLNLTACTQVKECSLRLGFTSPANYVLLSCILIRLPRTTLETVTLYFNAAPADSPAAAGVRVLDAVLSRFPVLRELAVRVPRHAQKSEPELDAIRAAWPRTASRAHVTVANE